MTSLREQTMARLEAADTYAQTLSESRQASYVDAEMVRRLTADAGAARKSAEVIALVRIGDAAERLAHAAEFVMGRLYPTKAKCAESAICKRCGL